MSEKGNLTDKGAASGEAIFWARIWGKRTKRQSQQAQGDSAIRGSF
jgi:hypothetical protein